MFMANNACLRLAMMTVKKVIVPLSTCEISHLIQKKHIYVILHSKKCEREFNVMQYLYNSHRLAINTRKERFC